MMTQIITKEMGVGGAKQFIYNVENDVDSLYMFAGKHLPHTPNDAVVISPTDTVGESVNIYDNIIMGKRVVSSDMSYMVKRNNWLSGESYDMYDHEDPDLFDKSFYSVVNNGITVGVYKCLDNNGGANSTVQPSGNTIVYSPVDGYTWSYMYSVDTNTFNKFQKYIYAPVIQEANNSGLGAGTIEHLEITSGGVGYNNYYSSEFRSSDLRFGDVPSVTYALNDSASSVDGYYNNCVLKMTSGIATGEYRVITNYVITGGKKQITIDRPFTSPSIPGSTDSYEVYPFVYVYGDGHNTTNCDARAIVDPDNSNTISYIEILNPGLYYRNALAEIKTANVVPVISECVLRPIISPKGGHGSDPISELGANKVAISIEFDGNEGNTIPSTNEFRTIGLIKNPKFDNVTVTFDILSTLGSFVIGEEVYQYKDIRLYGSSVTTANSQSITGTSTTFSDSLSVGSRLLITDGVDRVIGDVLTISNNTTLTIDHTSSVSLSNAAIYLIDTELFGTVSSTTFDTLVLTDVPANRDSSTIKIYGGTSFTTSVIDQTATTPISVNGSSSNNNFSTFVGMHKFKGELTSLGTDFNPDEMVYLQGVNPDSALSSDARAYIHSFTNGSAGEDVLYVTNMFGKFNVGDILVGVDSGATFEIYNKYDGNILIDSGDILYIENFSPIPRSNTTTETIKLILEF